MLEITPRAEDHLLRLRGERGFDQADGARFETNAGRLRLTFAQAPQPSDRILDGARLPIFVAADASERLDGATIDVESHDGKTGLIVRRTPRPGASSGGAKLN